jgi:hypothetical protein
MSNPDTDQNDKRRSGWEEHEISQLLYFRSLSLRDRMKALEEMDEICRRLEKAREQRRQRPSDKTDP